MNLNSIAVSDLDKSSEVSSLFVLIHNVEQLMNNLQQVQSQVAEYSQNIELN